MSQSLLFDVHAAFIPLCPLACLAHAQMSSHHWCVDHDSHPWRRATPMISADSSASSTITARPGSTPPSSSPSSVLHAVLASVSH